MFYIICLLILIVFIYLALTPDMERDFINNIKLKIKFKNGNKLIKFLFILVVVFNWLLFSDISNPNVGVLFIITLLTCMCWMYMFSKFNKLSEDIRVKLIIIGGLFVAACMTATSMPLEQKNNEDISRIYQLKIFWNFIYLVMPAFFIYELSKKNKLLELLSKYRKYRRYLRRKTIDLNKREQQ